MTEYIVRLIFDASKANKQIDLLLELLAKFSLDFIEQFIARSLLDIVDDIVFDDLVTTTGTDGTVHIVQSYHLGDGFERAVAALRAIK
jgi:hypothetical protein